MRTILRNYLRSQAEARKAKALLTLELFDQNPAAIGDHSTGDLYDNIDEAYRAFIDAEDELGNLDNLENELTPPYPDALDNWFHESFMNQANCDNDNVESSKFVKEEPVKEESEDTADYSISINIPSIGKINVELEMEEGQDIAEGDLAKILMELSKLL